MRGPDAGKVIEEIIQAIELYPYKQRYTMWPGPNSNTFTAFIGRHVPHLKLDLPPTAIGKDFLGNGKIFATAPSSTGFQVSLYGLFGILYGQYEGIEINILGLVMGVHPSSLALKLPGVGRIGFNL